MSIKKITKAEVENLINETTNILDLGDYVVAFTKGKTVCVEWCNAPMFEMELPKEKGEFDEFITGFNERVVVILTTLVVDCGECYKMLEECIGEHYRVGEMEFAPIKLITGETITSNSSDDRELSIWEWGFGTDTHRVCVGDVATNYEELFGSGRVICDMVQLLESKMKH